MSSPSSLETKVALVTGSARRIGRSIVRRLHEAGATVAIHYRGSAAEAAALAADLNADRPDSAAVFCGDLTRLEVIEALVSVILCCSYTMSTPNIQLKTLCQPDNRR